MVGPIVSTSDGVCRQRALADPLPAVGDREASSASEQVSQLPLVSPSTPGPCKPYTGSPVPQPYAAGIKWTFFGSLIVASISDTVALSAGWTNWGASSLSGTSTKRRLGRRGWGTLRLRLSMISLL